MDANQGGKQMQMKVASGRDERNSDVELKHAHSSILRGREHACSTVGQ